jgi:hypothetical protein
VLELFLQVGLILLISSLYKDTTGGQTIRLLLQVSCPYREGEDLLIMGEHPALSPSR